MRRAALGTALAALAAASAVAADPAALRTCVAQESAPYSSLDDGQPRGFDVELLTSMSRRMGRALELVWFEGRYDREGNLSLDARALLAARACDIVAGIPLYEPQLAPMLADKARTPDYPGAKPLRQRPYQALVPVIGGGAYRATAMVLVARGGSTLRSLADAQGHTIAVRAGSMASLALGAWRSGVLATSIKGYNVREDVLAAVEAGEAELALVDVALWDRYRSRVPATRLAPTGFEHPVKINIGVLVRQDDAGLMTELTRALADEIAARQAAEPAPIDRATWVRPVLPAVRPALSLRDFEIGGGG